MALAHQTEVQGVANSVAGAYSTAVTPAAAPNAVCAIAINSTSTTDVITSVTYGGIALTRRRFDVEVTEPGGVFSYWGAGAFPSGTQNLVVNRTGTNNLRVVVSTMTVTDPANFTVAIDSDATGQSASVANPSWTHTSLVNDVVAYLGIHSGLQTMTTTPATNWTQQGTAEDVGVVGRGWARRTLATAGALAPGWTAATADDFVGSSIAFKEIPLPPVVVDPVHATAAGRLTNPGRQAPTIYNY